MHAEVQEKLAEVMDDRVGLVDMAEDTDMSDDESDGEGMGATSALLAHEALFETVGGVDGWVEFYEQPTTDPLRQDRTYR